MFAPLALAAVLIEAAFGYPNWLMARAGHPVMWLGRLIAWCDTRWNTSSRSEFDRRISGTKALVMIVAIFAATAALIGHIATTLLGGTTAGTLAAGLILALLASTLIAQRSLFEHVSSVADALDQDGLEAGRTAVAKIVGRETQDLDTHEVSRAAIESLAENFSDGVVAPVFWLTIAGLPGIVAYKAVNTADSMIGHMTDKYRAFGFTAAKTDDLMNLPASRLAAALLTTAAALSPNASATSAARAVARDAQAHRSPNAGWPEAAIGGALKLALGGPRTYNGKTEDDAWMGNGRRDATPDDIKAALKLYSTACIIQAFVLAAISALTWYLA